MTPQNATRFGAVFACVRVIAETMATLPLHVMERNAAGGRASRIAYEHPVYRLLHDAPNPEQTTVEWREYMWGHLELRGNAYSEIVWKGDTPVALWPLHPDYVEPERGEDKRLRYRVQVPGINEGRLLPARSVLHIKTFGWDTLKGMSPIQYMATTIGASLAGQDFGARVFSSNGMLRPALLTDQPMDRETAQAKANAFKDAYSGLENAWRVAFLDSGIRVENIGVHPKDAQLMELLDWGAEDVCRAYRIQQHKVGILKHATFSNIEEQNIDFKTDTLLPRAERFEKAVNRALLSNDSDTFCRHNMDGVLRGNIADRMTAHSIAIQNGIKSPNECRDDEDLNPYEGGDVYLLPLNMTPSDSTPADADAADGTSESKAIPETRCMCGACEDHDDGEVRRVAVTAEMRTAAEKRSKNREPFIGLLAEQYRKLIKRNDVESLKQIERFLGIRADGDSWDEWLESFKTTNPDVAASVLGATIEAMAKRFALDAADKLAGGVLPTDIDGAVDLLKRQIADRYTMWYANKLDAIRYKYGQDYTLEMIKGDMERWEEGLSKYLAQQDTVFTDGDMTRYTWRNNGVERVVWVAVGSETCPLCQELDGRVVGINDTFTDATEAFESEHPHSIFKPSGNIFHPPLHDGCVCDISIQ